MYRPRNNAEGGLYYSQVGPVFGYVTFVPFLAYPVVYALALRNRRNIHRHAGYMLATLFPLWEPGWVRIMLGIIPSMSINGPGDFHKVTDGIALSIAMALAVAIFLYFRDRKHGTPFLLIGVFLALQIAGCYWVADTELWRGWFDAYSQAPAVMIVTTGFLVGTIAGWVGWRQPADQSRVIVME